jgi:hypothetical protein
MPERVPDQEGRRLLLAPPMRRGSLFLQPAPLSQQSPIGVLAGESEAPISPPEQVPLLVVDEGGISSTLPPALRLEVVERAGADLSQVGLAALLEPSHARIVPDRAKASTGD